MLSSVGEGLGVGLSTCHKCCLGTPAPAWATVGMHGCCFFLPAFSCTFLSTRPASSTEISYSFGPSEGVGEGRLPMASTAKTTRQALGLHGLLAFMQYSGLQPF